MCDQQIDLMWVILDFLELIMSIISLILVDYHFYMFIILRGAFYYVHADFVCCFDQFPIIKFEI